MVRPPARGGTINRPRPSSEPEGLITGDQLDVDARVPEDMAAARVEHVLAAEDGAPLAAADDDAARDGRDAADWLVAVAVVELAAAGVVGGQAAAAHLRRPRVPARAEGEQDAAAEGDRAGRVVEGAHAPVTGVDHTGVDQLQAGRAVDLLLLALAVDQGLVVDAGDGQPAVPQPDGAPVGFVNSIRRRIKRNRTG